MGSFFTNAHVRLGPGAPLAPLLEALAWLARDGGFDPVEDHDTADRTIVVMPDASGWISIYDEAAEDQDSRKLAHLATALSRGGAPVVTVLVHDSDVLQLGLFIGGEAIDAYDGNPGFSSARPSAKRKREAAGHAERWAPVLAPEATIEALAAAWKGDSVFAESALASIAELLGCPPDRMAMGYRYLQQIPAVARPAGDVVRLAFRLRDRPAHEANAEGPTVITLAIPPTREQLLAVGDELRVSLGGRNTGGASRGLTVSVTGDAITRGLVAVDAIEIVVGNVLDGAHRETVTPVREEAHLVARRPDCVLPAGVRGGHLALVGAADFHRAYATFQRSAVHVNVVGRVLTPGRASLDIGISPDENPAQGALFGTQPLVISAPLYRPLRAVAGVPSHDIRPLSGRSALFALLVYGVDRAAAVAHARRAFTRLVAISTPQPAYSVSVFRSAPGARPKSGRFAAAGFLTGRRWKSLDAEMAKEAQVCIDPGRGPEDDPMGGVSMSFGGEIITPYGNDARELPALALSIGIDDLSPQAREAARAAMIDVLDEGMRELGGVQATLARWSQTGRLDYTSYERAAGIHGCTTRASWVTRWVRAVGNEALWLGPELMRRLGTEGHAAAAAVTRARTIGPSTCFELPSPDDVGALEQALESLLPGAADYMEWIQRG